MNRKGSAPIIALIIAVGIMAIGGIAYYAIHVRLLDRTTQTASAPNSTSVQTLTTLSTPQTISSSSAIEKIDFQKFLAGKYENQYKGNGGESECPTGSTSISKIQYGDLTGSNAEDAVVDYYTCLNGTGGGSSAVFALDDGGNLENLTPASPDGTGYFSVNYPNFSTTTYEKLFDGLEGGGYFGISNSELTYTFPIYAGSDPECCPSGGYATLYFKWNGSNFIYQNEARSSSTQP